MTLAELKKELKKELDNNYNYYIKHKMPLRQVYIRELFRINSLINKAFENGKNEGYKETIIKIEKTT